MPTHEVRLVLTVSDCDHATTFFRDALGLKERTTFRTRRDSADVIHPHRGIATWVRRRSVSLTGLESRQKFLEEPGKGILLLLGQARQHLVLTTSVGVDGLV